MSTGRSAPRIPPLPMQERTPIQQELMAGISMEQGSNIFNTLLRHPGLFRRWLPFGGKLLSGLLPARDRELLILRVGWRCGSEYEWAQHAVIGGQAGVTDDELQRITEGPDAPEWDAFDALLLRAADELHDTSTLTDTTWIALKQRYDDRQMIEALMLVGHYHLVSYVLNSVGVSLEAGMQGFPTSGHHLIPPGVNAHEAELLARAYDLSDQEEGQQLYAEWATTYDATMLEALGYVSPARLVERFAHEVSWRDRRVLDVGCGTGLVGVELVKRDFVLVDGLDLSNAMLVQARARGLYDRLRRADLTQPLPISDGAYDAVICNGTFTSGHVGAGCLDELLRILVPGGVLAAAVHHAVWDTFGFRDAFGRLLLQGRLERLDIVESVYYDSSTTTDGRLCLFRRC